MTWFELFQDYTFQIVALGCGMLGLLSGVVGSFAVLRRESLLGDVVSHASLPGIVIAFLVLGYKNWYILLLGAVISGLLATRLIRWMSEKNMKLDSALALVLTTFFGFGLVLLTVVQRLPNANQAGLDSFIYGQASGMLVRDVFTILAVGIIILILVALFWKEIKVFTFDSEYAYTLGLHSKVVQFLLSSLLVLVIILGLEAVGVILMSTLIIAPAVSARQWTDNLVTMVVLAGVFGALSGVMGTAISSYMLQMPTGPTIVLVASVIVFVSIFFAPHRGLISRHLEMSHQKKEIEIRLEKIIREEEK